MRAAGFNRRATLLALGGGVVGDVTGVNHPRGKNMIGAFHQPRAMIVDTDTLATLPARELSAGLAEVIKYGLIHDTVFLDWLEANMAGLRRLEAALERVERVIEAAGCRATCPRRSTPTAFCH